MSINESTYGRAGRKRAFAPTLAPDDQSRLVNALKLNRRVPDDFSSALRDLAREWTDDVASAELRAISLLVADLHEQGWNVRFAKNHLVFEPPGLGQSDTETVMMVKERVQRALRVGRDRQLREPSVRAFIHRMERSRDRGLGRPTSIFDVIDSGQALAEGLEAVRTAEPGDRLAALRKFIRPEIEVCDPTTRCRNTNIRLIDIWRYFRHTWSHEYRSIPGRQMMVLLRNAARPGRPVMGIAMLASPVMRLGARDNWIGWLSGAAEEAITTEKWRPGAFVRACRKRIDDSIGDIRWDDLVTSKEIAAPTENVIFRLEQKAAGAAHQREAQLKRKFRSSKMQVRSVPKGKKGWRAASEDLLFVRKRAEGLAELLFGKMVLADAPQRPKKADVERLFASKRGRRAIDIALAEFRKAGLSSRVADVSVCGAVHPYNELLAGKLVALVLGSQAVRDAYAKRYGGQISVIASQMAGRPITKPASLKILTTTSLYGVGSSQYNRLVLRRKDHAALPFDLAWQAIEKNLTGGFGTLHLGVETVEALRAVGEKRHASRRINNRFGEGTSPRLRQVREGLDALGVESDKILHHATPRLFYGCELEPGARESLIFTPAKKDRRGPTLAAIGRAWQGRWVLGRITHGEIDILQRMRSLGPDSVRALLAVAPVDESAPPRTANADRADAKARRTARKTPARGSDNTSRTKRSGRKEKGASSASRKLKTSDARQKAAVPNRKRRPPAQRKRRG